MTDQKRRGLAHRALDALAGRAAEHPDELARIARRLDALDATLTALAQHPAPRYDDQLGTVREALAGVEKDKPASAWVFALYGFLFLVAMALVLVWLSGAPL